jgi:fructuronate reductase
MAYAGTIRGHDTVEQAISDPVVRGWVEQWWDDAARHLPLPPEEIAAYRAALLERYANPRIRHLLAQIAADGSQKVPIRILPTVRADLAQGSVPTGAARVLGAWVCHLRGQDASVADVAAEEFTALAAGKLDDAVSRVLARLGADDPRLQAAVTALARELQANTGATPGNRLPE